MPALNGTCRRRRIKNSTAASGGHRVFEVVNPLSFGFVMVVVGKKRHIVTEHARSLPLNVLPRFVYIGIVLDFLNDVLG